MENSKLEEDIKSMSEETAQELAKAFSDFNEQAEAFNKAFDENLRLYALETRRACAMKFVDMVHKVVCSSILTRWYWKRKARKCNDVLIRIIEFSKEIEKPKNEQV